MTSSSSLYGTVTTQNASSTNSTSLYGGADTPIPDSSGNVIVRGDLYVLSGNILTTATTGNIFPQNATTINLGNAATAVNIGANTGTTTINNNLSVDGTGTFAGNISATGGTFSGAITATTGTFSGDITATGGDFGNITIAITDNNTIDTTTGDLNLSSTNGVIGMVGVDTLYSDQSSFLLLNAPTTITAFDSATTLNLGDVTGTTFIRNDVTVGGDLKINGNDIKSNGGTIALSLSGANVVVAGDLTVSGNDIKSSTGTPITLSGDNATINGNLVTDGDLTILGGDLTVAGNGYIYSATDLALDLTGADVRVANDLTVSGDNINLAASTLIGYSENNNRANRPEVQSTTGNSSGFRVIAPGATTASNSNLTVFNTNDINNGSFMNVQAIGSTTAPFIVRTGTYTGGTLGASNKVITFLDGTTTYATLNPAGPTTGTDLTTKTYVDSIIPDVPTYDTNVAPATGGVDLQLRELNPPSITIVGTTTFLGGTNITVSETSPNVITIDGTDLNTTYTVDASTTTGGANFNLAGSDSSVDTIKFANGTNVTVTATDANTITIAATDTNTTYNIDASSTTGGANLNLNGSDSTVDPVAFKGSGATTVTRTDANTITVSSTDTNTTYTQDVSSTSGGANLNLVGSDLTTDSVKFAGGTNVSIVATDASTMTINATDTNTTYDFNATSTTGGANLNLVGSDSTTDTVKLTNGGHITATYTSGTVVTLGSDATDANTAGAIVARDGSGNFSAGTITASLSGNATTATTAGKVANSLTAGTHLSGGPYDGSAAVTLTTDATNANTASTIVARDANGDFSAGTITANLANGTRVLGALTATPSTTYSFPTPALTTISDNNGLDAVSSYNSGVSASLGNGAQGQFAHYFGDTFAAGNTGAVFSLRTANGNSQTTGTIPFTGLSPTAPSAVTSANVIGGMNFNGYGTTGFSDYIGTANQGGGFNALHAGSVQFAPAETFADGTLTISGATITAVSRVNAAQTVTAIAGTRGQLTIPSTLAGVGTAVVVTGTNSGTGTGITAGTYYIVANNGGASNSTQITLSSTVGGPPITTTAGTTTGLTFTRQLITATYTAQTNIPFGLNAKVAVSGITNVTTGTFMVVGAPTTTSVTIGATSSGVPALSGSQSLSVPSMTNVGATFRVRGFPLATTMTAGNRVDFVNHSAASATYRADTFAIAGGAYGNTSSSRLTVDATKITAALPVVFPSYTKAQANALTGAIGWQICISDSAAGSNPNGMMAFWDTTNARWSYIHDNSAV